MIKSTKIIISPYFSNNTNLVANFCKWCYSRAKNVLVTSINITFLKIHDPEQYRNFISKTINNITRNSDDITSTAAPFKGFTKKEISKSLYKVNNFYYQNLMSLRFNKIKFTKRAKRGIMKKYTIFYRKYVSRRKNKNNEQNENYQWNFNEMNTFETGIGKIEPSKEKLNINFQTRIANVVHRTEIENSESLGKITPSKIFSTLIAKKENDLIKEECIEIESNFENTETQSGIKLSKWIPPISPHNLIEERYYQDPWALFVVTIFLNKTSCNIASPYMDKFFGNFNGPYDVLKAQIFELEPYFYKIGLVKTRATQIWRMSYDFVHKDWKRAKELYGIGKYAEDAYRMFHLGDFSVQPTDRYLRIYKAWYEMTQKQSELGRFEANSQVYLEDYYVAPEDDEDRRGDNCGEEDD